MKKTITLFLALALTLSLAACGGSEDVTESNDSNTTQVESSTSVVEQEEQQEEQLEEPQVRYLIGETVAVDGIEFTLDNAALTYALHKDGGDYYIWEADSAYYTAKEYDAEVDGDNPLVANVGSTLVAFEYTIYNSGRGVYDIEHPRVSVSYGGEIYEPQDISIGTISPDTVQDDFQSRAGMTKTSTIYPGMWFKRDLDMANLYKGTLNVDNAEHIRASVLIPVEIEDLTEEFEITFSIKGMYEEFEDTETFTYSVS